MTALVTIGVFLLIIAFVSGLIQIEDLYGEDSWQQWVYGLIFVVGFVLFTVGSLSLMKRDAMPKGYDNGQIDALKGIQTHEIFYVYPINDSIASDTLYLPKL
ncbi:MAG TPA: hypothetical protein ENH82_15210 [bacterium]|nr:hypothetical protein [bacterium]